MRLPRAALLPLLALSLAHARSSAPTVPSSAYIPSLTFERQSWNNCGPASVAGVLGAYGYKVTQLEAAKVLRPTGEGYMTSDVIDAYVQNFGLRATRFKGGSVSSVKQVIGLGVPVIVVQWLRGKSDGKTFVGEIPHFRTVRGYDDKTAQFWVNDPLIGENAVVSYQDFVTLWSVYGNEFIPVYPKGMEVKLERALGVRIPKA